MVVADRDESAATTAAAEINGHAHVVDVTDVAAVEEMADWVRSTWGRPDVLVNNAGVGPQDEFASFSLADLKWVHDIDYWGVVHGIKAFLPLLQDNTEGAAIMNTASMASFLVGRGATACAPAKAAVLALSDSLRAELAPAGRVGGTVLFPAMVDTNIGANAAHRPGHADRSADTAEFLPSDMGRPTSADRVGDLVLEGLHRGSTTCSPTQTPFRWLLLASPAAGGQQGGPVSDMADGRLSIDSLLVADIRIPTSTRGAITMTIIEVTP